MALIWRPRLIKYATLSLHCSSAYLAGAVDRSSASDLRYFSTQPSAPSSFKAQTRELLKRVHPDLFQDPLAKVLALCMHTWHQRCNVRLESRRAR